MLQFVSSQSRIFGIGVKSHKNEVDSVLYEGHGVGMNLFHLKTNWRIFLTTPVSRIFFFFARIRQ